MDRPERVLGVIRHADKQKAGQERKPLEESGLSSEQQRIWKEAVTSLNIADDPELKYGSLPQIQQLAKEIYAALPNKATVLITTNKKPRTILTADFLSTELYRIAGEDAENKKEIKVGYIWEPADVAEKSDSLTNVGGGAPGLLELVNSLIKAKEGLFSGNDVEKKEATEAYVGHATGGRTHEKELDFLLEAVNQDLASPDSILKNRAKEIIEQNKKFSEVFADVKEPVFLFGVGHASSYLALDILLNKKDRYNSAEEMPKPLALLKIENQTQRD